MTPKAYESWKASSGVAAATAAARWKRKALTSTAVAPAATDASADELAAFFDMSAGTAVQPAQPQRQPQQAAEEATREIKEHAESPEPDLEAALPPVLELQPEQSPQQQSPQQQPLQPQPQPQPQPSQQPELEPQQPEPEHVLEPQLNESAPARQLLHRPNAELRPEPEPVLQLQPEQEPQRSEPVHARTSPRWVMDEETVGCMLCTAEFNFWTRRHHCRYCGVLVCGDCLAPGQIHSDRWLSEEDGRSLLHDAGPDGFTRAIQVCSTCSKLAPAEIRQRADADKTQRRRSAARERAEKDAALLDKAQLNAVRIDELQQKATVAGVSVSRVGKAQDTSSPRRALVALVIEANLLSSQLTVDEIRRPLAAVRPT